MGFFDDFIPGGGGDDDGGNDSGGDSGSSPPSDGGSNDGDSGGIDDGESFERSLPGNGGGSSGGSGSSGSSDSGSSGGSGSGSSSGGSSDPIDDGESFERSLPGNGGGSSSGSGSDSISDSESFEESVDNIGGGSADFSDDDDGGGGSGSSSDSSGSSSERSSDPSNITDAESFNKSVENISKSNKTQLPDSQEKVNQAQSFRDNNKLIAASNPRFGEFLESREQNLKTKNQINSQINALKNASRNTKVQFGSGENKEVVPRSKALDKLKQKEDKVNELLQDNELRFQGENPDSNLITPSKETQKDVRNLLETNGRTTLSIEEKASKGNLDNLEATLNIPFVGGKNDFTLTGPPAKAAASFDTFTSDQGFEQLAAGLNPGDSGSRVIKENIAEKRRDRFNTGNRFEIVDETVNTFSSPAGLAVGSGLLGGSFKAGTTALAAKGGRAATAAKGIQAGGAAVGTAYTGLELEESRQDFKSGNTTEGTENLLKLGTEELAFAGGFRKAGKSLSPDIDGPVRIKQLSKLESTGDNDFVGSGQFEGETNIKQSGLAERLGVGESGKAEVSGDFNVRGGDGTSEARGTLELELPSGRTRTKDFESLSVEKLDSETASGDDVVFTDDVLRTFDEGRLFKTADTSESTTKSIKEGETSLSEVVSERDGVVIRDADQKGRVVDRSTFSRAGSDTEIFGDSRVVVDEGSGSGSRKGAVSGSGGGQKLEVQSVDEGGQVVSTDLVGREFVDLAARPPGNTKTGLSPFSIGGGSGASGRSAEGVIQNNRGGGRNPEKVDSVESLQVQQKSGGDQVEKALRRGSRDLLQLSGDTQRTEEDLDLSGTEGLESVDRNIEDDIISSSTNKVITETKDQDLTNKLGLDEKLGEKQEEKPLQETDVITKQDQRNIEEVEQRTRLEQFQVERPLLTEITNTPNTTGFTDTPRTPPFITTDKPELSLEGDSSNDSFFGDSKDTVFKASVGAELAGVFSDEKPENFQDPTSLRPIIENKPADEQTLF